jgi:hypothetical protein
LAQSWGSEKLTQEELSEGLQKGKKLKEKGENISDRRNYMDKGLGKTRIAEIKKLKKYKWQEVAVAFTWSWMM